MQGNNFQLSISSHKTLSEYCHAFNSSNHCELMHLQKLQMKVSGKDHNFWYSPYIFNALSTEFSATLFVKLLLLYLLG